MFFKKQVIKEEIILVRNKNNVRHCLHSIMSNKGFTTSDTQIVN